MDLGLTGKWALVCAASKGLGKGCAAALVKEGVNVVITARGVEALEATASELRVLGSAEVRTVAGDITTVEGRAAALAACPQVDILINNAGGPPPGDFRDWDREAWIQALDANMLTPIELIRATVDGVSGDINSFKSSFAGPSDLASSHGAIGFPMQNAFDGASSGLAVKSDLMWSGWFVTTMPPSWMSSGRP